MVDHEQYEILCAWVASGRASVDDLEQLTLHLPSCDDCRRRLSDFAQVSAQALPLYGEAITRGHVPSGMTGRFIERARLKGIPVRPSSHLSLRNHMSPGVEWAAAAAVIVVLAGVITIRTEQGGWSARPSGKPFAATQVHAGTPAQNESKPLPVADYSQQIARLRSEISSSQREVAALELELNSLRQELMASDSIKAALSSRLAEIENDNAGLRLQATTKDSSLADLETQIKLRDASNIEEIANLVQQQSEVQDLRAQLAQREDKLEQERQLLAASTQARDLIVARNLHIIDVHDNDRSGRQRPFGRIFYTEGRSLVFYAYDLEAASRHGAKVSFHVWGGKLGGHVQSQNLGIFHTEDVAAGRWVLTCDDPRVLAEINTVFVTMESGNDNLNHPKGPRILYAFLGDPANHP